MQKGKSIKVSEAHIDKASTNIKEKERKDRNKESFLFFPIGVLETFTVAT